MKDHCGTKTTRWVPDHLLGFDLTWPCIVHDIETSFADNRGAKSWADKNFRASLLSRRNVLETRLLASGHVKASRLLRGLLAPLRYAIAWTYYLAVASPIGSRHWKNLQAAKKETPE